MKDLARRDFIKMGLVFSGGIFLNPTLQFAFGNVPLGISKKDIEKIIDEALIKGADFAEIFDEKSVINTITINSRNVVNNEAHYESGLGLRVFIGDEVQYLWTDDFSKKGTSHLVSELKEALVKDKKKVVFKPFIETSFPEVSHIKVMPDKTPNKQKLEYLRAIESYVYDYDTRVKNAILLYYDKTQDLTIANSESLFIQGRKCDIILIAIALVQDNGSYSIGGSLIGGSIGTEIFEKEAPEKIAHEAAVQALEGINARPIPQGKMPIIFSNKSGVFHECLGHPLEARHRDGVFKDKVGEQLTPQPLTVIDDATIPGLGASYSFDDEGTQSQRNVLIENGVLKNFMYDKFYAKKYGTKSTGNGRRASYKFPPLVRMSNLIIEAGNIPFEDMLKDTKQGILVSSGFGGGRSFVYEGIYVAFLFIFLHREW